MLLGWAEHIGVLLSPATDLRVSFHKATKKMRDEFFRQLNVSRQRNLGVGGKNKLKRILGKWIC